MNIRNTNVLDVISRTRSGAWRETRWLAVHVGIAAVVMVIAAAGLPELGPSALWFLAGLAVADTLAVAGRAWAAWQELRRLTRCADCRVLAAAVDLAIDSYSGCSVEHVHRWGA